MLEDFSIQELAERLGVSPRTIRYYIEEGLLAEPHGSGRNQRFSREHEDRLKVAKALRDLGLTVKAVRAALASTPIDVLQKRLAGMQRHLGPEQLTAMLGDVGPSEPEPRSSVRERFASVEESAPPEHTFGLRALSRRLSGQGRPERSATWFRVSLAPGVELHYQQSGDERRDAAIQGIVRDAEKRLAPFD